MPLDKMMYTVQTFFCERFNNRPSFFHFVILTSIGTPYNPYENQKVYFCDQISPQTLRKLYLEDHLPLRMYCSCSWIYFEGKKGKN